MNFSDEVVEIYSSCRYVERIILRNCWEVTLTPSPYVLEDWMYFQYITLGYGNGQPYIDALYRSWGLVKETIAEGTIVYNRYRCNVARIAALGEKFLLGQIDQCMPYSSLVNFVNAAVVVPPPC